MVPRSENGFALHGRDEVWLGQDVILQLDVEDASPLRVHHEEGVVKILK